MAHFGNRKWADEEPTGINEFFEEMSDYLVTVEPNSLSGQSIKTYRLIGKSDDYREGFVTALKMQYDTLNKYRIIETKI